MSILWPITNVIASVRVSSYATTRSSTVTKNAVSNGPRDYRAVKFMQIPHQNTRYRLILTSEGLHVGHSHPEYRQFVRLPRESAAGGHHVRQLRDVGRHLVPPPTLNFAVILPTVSCKKSHRSLYFFNKRYNLFSSRYHFGAPQPLDVQFFRTSMSCSL